MQLVKRVTRFKISLMFNVDTMVKNHRTSLFGQLISRHLWKQVTLVILTLNRGPLNTGLTVVLVF